VQETSTRPLGATLLSLLLGWDALVGVINAFAWKVASPTFNDASSPLLSIFVYTAQSWRFTILALAYGLTALAAAIGIWRLRPWMVRAFLVWSATAMTLLVWLALVARQETPADSQVATWPWLMGAAAVLAILYFYVHSLAKGARRAAL
jgi:heme exporter protein D